MTFTYQERQELNLLSKAVFGTKSWWYNKLLKRVDLKGFIEIREYIYKIQMEQSRALQSFRKDEKGQNETVRETTDGNSGS